MIVPYYIGQGLIEQVHMMHGAVDLALDIGKVGAVDMSKFATSFDAIVKIVDDWRDVDGQGVMATFELEVTKRQAELDVQLADIAIRKSRKKEAIEDL